MTDPIAELLAQLRAEAQSLRVALGHLHTLVWGECPSLLNGDSGGDAELDLRIKMLILPDCSHTPRLAALVPSSPPEQAGKAGESDAEWRQRWHARLGRRPNETEGRFYERIERTEQP